jgi:hypothetical protein
LTEELTSIIVELLLAALLTSPLAREVPSWPIVLLADEDDEEDVEAAPAALDSFGYIGEWYSGVGETAEAMKEDDRALEKDENVGDVRVSSTEY